MSNVQETLKKFARALIPETIVNEIITQIDFGQVEKDILAAQWTEGGIINGNGRYVVETKNSQCVVQMSAGGSMDRAGGMNIMRNFKIPT